MQSGVSALLGTADAAELAIQVHEAVSVRVGHGAPARVVQGTADELPPRDVLRILNSGRKSGRLVLRSDGPDGQLQFERGRVVWAGVDQARGEEALMQILRAKATEFVYDPDALLDGASAPGHRPRAGGAGARAGLRPGRVSARASPVTCICRRVRRAASGAGSSGGRNVPAMPVGTMRDASSNAIGRRRGSPWEAPARARERRRSALPRRMPGAAAPDGRHPAAVRAVATSDRAPPSVHPGDHGRLASAAEGCPLTHLAAESGRPARRSRSWPPRPARAEALQLGHPPRRLQHVGGLVLLPAVRNRREVGRVGLDQQPIQGREAHRLGERLGLLVGHHAGDGEVEAEVEVACGPRRGRR